ncbi:thiosulfate/3-mercaptopyruvate sulfurtransferase [Panacagrimonas perspica]|uniref:Thiosulfate/3-mercaptopyruvate sulfurtransferase n=1 Tax=Panacagrimonas perspica TaxID=381431 RepID=A0A4S3JZ04_9GAMM|nr:sulfurtransferase [Panacagrimonas perspica]TDU31418.1 thiosulfate/3-mercaptopyruvate sulfurtransferase [Panacagrimonas perspica]THD00823.1 hypothetical protein B1810_23190 [Panacagrimonas perspica]
MDYAHPEYLTETDWLEAHLGDPDLRVIDCTHYLPNYFDESAGRRIEMVSGRSHYEAGHIPGSAFVDLREDLCDRNNPRFMYPMPPAAQFEAVMSRLGVGPGTRVVLYDDMLNLWAARVWWMMRSFGFDGAAVLNGGWKKWVAENRPVSQASSTYPASSFVARTRPERIAKRDEVKAAIGDGATCLLNALDPEEFAGRGPVRYKRPGHIPSSVNVSFLGLLKPDTQIYLDADTLRAQFGHAGATGADRVIAYCGGAIAASSAAFALSLIGVENVALYDGSMTEWAADPSLPLV